MSLSLPNQNKLRNKNHPFHANISLYSKPHTEISFKKADTVKGS